MTSLVPRQIRHLHDDVILLPSFKFFSFASYLGSLFFEAQQDWKISIRKQERDEYLVVVIKCHREIKMRLNRTTIYPFWSGLRGEFWHIIFWIIDWIPIFEPTLSDGSSLSRSSKCLVILWSSDSTDVNDNFGNRVGAESVQKLYHSKLKTHLMNRFILHYPYSDNI